MSRKTDVVSLTGEEYDELIDDREWLRAELEQLRQRERELLDETEARYKENKRLREALKKIAKLSDESL